MEFVRLALAVEIIRVFFYLFVSKKWFGPHVGRQNDAETTSQVARSQTCKRYKIVGVLGFGIFFLALGGGSFVDTVLPLGSRVSSG